MTHEKEKKTIHDSWDNRVYPVESQKDAKESGHQVSVRHFVEQPRVLVRTPKYPVRSSWYRSGTRPKDVASGSWKMRTYDVEDNAGEEGIPTPNTLIGFKI